MDQELRRLERAVESDAADVELARRYEQALQRTGQQERLLERYRFKFQCPLRFQDLNETAHPLVRDCFKCGRNVYWVRSPAELAEKVRAGECVAFGRAALEGGFGALAAEPETHSAQEEGKPACVVPTDLELVDLDQLEIDPEVLSQMPPETAGEFACVPVRREGNTLFVAHASSTPNPTFETTLQFILGVDRVRLVVAEPDALERALDRCYPFRDSDWELVGDIMDPEFESLDT